MKEISFKVINKPLEELIFSFSDTLNEEKNKSKLHFFSYCFLLISQRNYKAIRKLVWDDFKFNPQANVISRVNFDILFTYCLMISNPGKYIPFFVKSGWREKSERLQKEKSDKYFEENEQEWLADYEKFVTTHSAIELISHEEQNNPRQMRWFPSPGSILNKENEYISDLNADIISVLKKLHVKYYKRLSQMSHGSDTGLAFLVGPLLGNFNKTDQQVMISEPVGDSMLALTCLLSEINIQFKYNYNQKIKEIWTYLAETIPLHKEIYQTKYQKIL